MDLGSGHCCVVLSKLFHVIESNGYSCNFLVPILVMSTKMLTMPVYSNYSYLYSEVDTLVATYDLAVDCHYCIVRNNAQKILDIIRSFRILSSYHAHICIFIPF